MKKRAANHFGYARVSREDQRLALQLDALKAAKCSRIFADHGVSGAKTKRPGLNDVLDRLSPGDTLVTWKLDRLGRKALHLIELLDKFQASDIQYQSLTEAIDIRTAAGELIYIVMAAFAQYDRRMIAERTKAGMAAARARGARIGRPRKLTQADVSFARRELKHGRRTAAQLAREWDVSRLTLARALKRSEESERNRRRPRQLKRAGRKRQRRSREAA